MCRSCMIEIVQLGRRCRTGHLMLKRATGASAHEHARARAEKEKVRVQGNTILCVLGYNTVPAFEPN